MKFIKENKLVAVVLLIFILIASFFGIRYLLTLDDIYIDSSIRNTDYQIIEKQYGINEYSKINISENQMAINYLNDYKNNLINDIDTAYNSLNVDYRNKRFGSLEAFKNYINGININDIILDKYQVKSKNKNDYYYLYDKNNNIYIFKITSVMEYELYLDDTTIEI